MPALAIRDLTIEYTGGGGYVVRPIDEFVLDVPPGSLVLLLGPSGCGKTSLLAALGAILTPTSGSIRLGDTEVTGLAGASLTEYRRHTVGIVFQAFNLVTSLSATENVTLPMLAAGVDARTAEARAVELLEGLNLGHRRRHHPGDMSGGEQQRVALARALALEPQMILADEPTAHLDYLQVETLLQTLRELASGERIVVVATHDHRLIPLADQIVELVPDLGATNEPPETQRFAAGEVIFEQNSWGTRIYVVEDGEVEILVEHADGTSERKAVVTAGSYFGEMGPLFNFPRTATARARTDVTLTAYGVRDFRSLITSDKLPPGAPPAPESSDVTGARRTGLVEFLAAHPFRRHAGRG
jgi:putative ABC transport system ATP-binding protein